MVFSIKQGHRELKDTFAKHNQKRGTMLTGSRIFRLKGYVDQVSGPEFQNQAGIMFPGTACSMIDGRLELLDQIPLSFFDTTCHN